MEEDDILYQSIIADPEQVSPNVDVSGLRTETQTDPRLLGAVSEFPGLQFDPTQYSAYADLYDLYSTGLPMIPTPATDTAQIPGATDILVDAGDEDQATGDLMQDLVPTENEQNITTPITEPNVYQGLPYIETAPNVYSAVNAQGQPIPGNIVDIATGNVYPPGDYSDVAGTTADLREVIDVAAPASQFVNQGFMEEDYGIYNPNVPTSSILDQTFTAPAMDTVDSDIFAGGIGQETSLPNDFAQPTLDTAGTGDVGIASDIAAQDRATADIPEIGLDSEFIVPTEGAILPQAPVVSPQAPVVSPQAPVVSPIDTATIDAQTADELAQQPILTPDEPGILDTAVSGVSTAAQNAFESVRSGASTVGDFISTYGYPVYQTLQGNLAAAGASFLTGLTPLALGANFAGKIFESVGDTKSKQEYDSYSPEQQSEIDKAYGPGGVMEGYNAVSMFGKGVEATINERLNTRKANGIYDETTQKLENLANKVNPNKVNVTPPMYDFDDPSDQEQITFDLDKADEAFAETGDYDEYSGVGTGFTGPTINIEDIQGEEEAPSPTPAPAPAPVYDFDYSSFFDRGNGDSGGGSSSSSTAGDAPGYSGASPFKKGGFVKKHAKR